MTTIPNVTFDDKSDAVVSPLPDNKKLVAADIAQIKSSINALQNQFQDTNFLFLGDPSANGTVRVMKTSSGFELSIMESGSYNNKAIFGETGIEFMEDLTIPPQTLSLGDDGYQISSAAQAAVVTDTSDRTAFLLTQLFTSSDGTSVLNAPLFTGEQPLTLQPLKDVNSEVDPIFTYTITATGDEVRRHTRQLTFESPDGGTASLVIRDTDENGSVLRSIENIAVTSNTEISIDFLPLCLDVGTVLHVTVSGGIRLKGTGSFDPFIRVMAHLGFDDKIVTDSTLNSFATGFRDALQTLTGDDRLQADSIRGLVPSQTGSDPIASALTVDIPPRVDIGHDLTGTHTLRFRVYNHGMITSLTLFIEEIGGLFQTHSLTVPTSNGTQTQTIDIISLSSGSERTYNFHLVLNNEVVSSSYIVRIENLDNIDGTDVNIDSDDLDSVQATNAQELASDLNDLFAIVNSGSPGTPMTRFSGVFVPFTGNLSINTENLFNLHTGNVSLYSNSADLRVSYTLPTDAFITAQGVATDQQVEYSILHLGGTSRITSGSIFDGPNNTIRVDVPGANNIRRGSDTGALLNFAQVFQRDLATFIQSERGQPWVFTGVTLSTSALLSPSGVFTLQSGIVLSARPSLGFLTGLPVNTVSQAGDAYLIGNDNDTFGGYGIQEGDILVAIHDSPSFALTSTNDDWVVIRNATNDIISLLEIRFLNTITEMDSFIDERLTDRSDVNEVNVFLATGVLDHAPFLDPSTDSNNPQSSNGAHYVGGREDRTPGNDFRLTDFTKVGLSSEATRFQAFVYFDIDGTFNVNELLDQVNVVVKNGQGEVVSTHNAISQFRGEVLSGTSDTYYAFNTTVAIDNYSSIEYVSGYTIEVQFHRTIRDFVLGPSVNVVQAIPDGSLSLSKITPNDRAIITANHGLSDAQETALDGLNTGGTATVWTSGDLYVRDSIASGTGDSTHYDNVGQQNGILSHFGHTRPIVFAVPTFVAVSGLQRQDDTSIKLPVTRIGPAAIQDNTQNPPTVFNGQLFSATLPDSTFNINDPVGDVWEVDGMASNLELTGAVDSFKIRTENTEDYAITQQKVDQSIRDLLASIPSGHTEGIPLNLRKFNDHITITDSALSGWRDVAPNPIAPIEVTREYKFLDGQTRANIDVDQFDDIDGSQITGHQDNNTFVYSDSSSHFNTSMPGYKSYLLNHEFNVVNKAPSNSIASTTNKMGAFVYANQVQAGSSSINVLKFGSSSEPFLAFDSEDALHVRIGRQDGGQRSRSYDIQLEVDNGHLHDRVDESVSAEIEIIIPQSLTGELSIRVDIELDNNGNNEGTHEETIVITNVSNSQNFGTLTWAYSGYPDIPATVEYDPDNNDLPNSRRVLFLRWSNPFTNAALTYNVEAHRIATETWNVPTSYAEFPVNAGNAHTSLGIFDETIWQYIRQPVKVFYALFNYRRGDTDTDPEQGFIVASQVSGGTVNVYSGRTHRPLSDFSLNQPIFSNFQFAMSDIVGFRYSAPGSVSFTENNARTIFGSYDDNLGLVTDRADIIETMLLNGNFEVGAGFGVILTTTDTSTRRVAELTSSGWSFKDA